MANLDDHQEKLKVFISYARVDLELADQLVAALQSIGFDLLIDRHDISAGEDWQERLGALIAQADSVAFLLSPNSLESERVAWEIDETDRLSKRLMPVVIMPLGSTRIPDRLQELQQIFLYAEPKLPGSGFGKGLGELVEALNTDIGWVREHTRLGQRSAEWHAGGRQENRLLSGGDIVDARNWLVCRPAKAPPPTELQLAFIKASENAQSARENAERRRLDEMASAQKEREKALASSARAQRQREVATLVGIIVAITLTLVASWNWWRASEAEDRALDERDRATQAAGDAVQNESRALLALSEVAFNQHRYVDAVKLSLAAWPRNSESGRPRLKSVIETLGQAQRHQRQMIPPIRHAKRVGLAAFNGDETRILTCSSGGARLWDVATGASVGSEMHHEEGVEICVFNSKKNRILTWSRYSEKADGGSLRLWDAANGKPVGNAMRHGDTVFGAAFNGDDSRILSWSGDGTARLWDAATGEQILPSMQHKKGVGGAVFNRDETRILTWADRAHLWDAATGEEVLPPMDDGRGYVRGAVFNGDETRILTWSEASQSWAEDGGARLWDAATGARVGAEMRPKGGAVGAVFNGDETSIFKWTGDIAHLWDARTGAPIGQPMRHASHVKGAVFNQDNSRILSSTHRTTIHTLSGPGAGGVEVLGSIHLWDATTGEELQSFPHDGEVDANFNRDETKILTWSEDGTVQLWNATTGKRAGNEMRHGSSVLGAIFDRDERRILTWSADGTARLWDATTGEQAGQAMHHDRRVKSVIFDDAQTRILTLSTGGGGAVTHGLPGEVRLWNARSGTPLGTLMTHNDSSARNSLSDSLIGGATFNRDNSRILTWSKDGTVRLWDAATSELLLRIQNDIVGIGIVYDVREEGLVALRLKKDAPAHRAGMQRGDVITHIDGESVVGLPLSEAIKRFQGPAGASIMLSIRRPNSEEPIKLSMSRAPIKYPAHLAAVRGAVFNRDETRILTWSEDGTARLWDAATGKVASPSMKHKGGVEGAVFNRGETHILTWSNDGTVHLWDAATGAEALPEMRHEGNPADHKVNGAVFNRENSRILSWSKDGTVRLWNTEIGKPVGSEMHQKDIHGAMFNGDETRIFTWSYNSRNANQSSRIIAQFWDAANGQPIGNGIRGNGSIVSEDKTQFMIWSNDDRTTRFWDAASGEPMGEMMHHDGPVYGAVFSPDETRILTFTWLKGDVRLWEAGSGRPVSDVMRHEDGVRGAVFNGDGTRVVTRSYRGTVRLWDLASGQEILMPLDHEGQVNGAVFSPDETRVLTWTDFIARLWDISRLPRGNLISIACEMLPDHEVAGLQDHYGIVIKEPICGHDTPPPVWSELVE